MAIRALQPLVALARDDRKQLSIARTDGDDQPPAVAELLAQRVRDCRRGRGDDDPVPRCAVRVAQAAVGLTDLDGAGERRIERVDARTGERDECRLPFERGDPCPEPGEDRGLVAGTGADLEDRSPGLARSWVILATMNGWLIVCPASMGSASSR
jgi:hypothetical protein